MLELIILVALAALGIFSTINTYSAANIHGMWAVFKFSLLMIPLNFAGVMLLTYAFSEGYRFFSGRFWVISLVVALAAQTMGLIIPLLMLRQIPHRGEIVGLLLGFIGALIAVLWK